MLRDNYRLYQLKKFLLLGKPKKDILFVINNSNQAGQDRVDSNIQFCRKLLEYLPDEEGEYVQTRICFYKYFNSSYTLIGDWSSNKNDVSKNLASLNRNNFL